MASLPLFLTRDLAGTLSELAGSAAVLPDLLGIPRGIRYRAVFQSEGLREWSFAAGLITLGEDPSDPASVSWGAAQLAFAEVRASIADIASIDAMRDFLYLCTDSVEGDHLLRGFRDDFNARRYSGEFRPNGPPRWELSVYPIQDGPRGQVARQRTNSAIVNPQRGFFASNPAEAIDLWLNQGTGTTVSRINTVAIAIPDRRAWLRSADRKEDTLTVTLQGFARAGLYCCSSTTDTEGRTAPKLTPFENDVADIRLDPSVDKLEIAVTDEAGFIFDNLVETPVFRSHATSVLRQAPVLGVAGQTLQRLLAFGESEELEAKAWLPTARDSAKSRELLEVACSFANTAGGSIFVGVTDRLEVMGIAQALFAWSANAGRHPEAGRSEYVATLRRLLTEGLSPTVAATFTWVPFAGHMVLAIRIARSNRAVAMAESHEVFVRRGASTRRASPPELAILFHQP